MALAEIFARMIGQSIAGKIQDRAAHEAALGEVNYAGFFARAAAHLIDGFVFGVAFLPIGYVAKSGMGVGSGALMGLQVVAVIAYFAFMEGSEKQATLGKMALGLKVVDENDARLSMGAALWRNSARLISVGLLGIGYLLPLFTLKHQALHDLLAGTYVIKAKNPAPALSDTRRNPTNLPARPRTP